MSRFVLIMISLLLLGHLPIAAELKVAILGTGITQGQVEAFNPETLSKILKRVKEEKPDLVFYSGNLILNLEQSTSLESIKEFEKNLNLFSEIVKETLGDSIPLYPVLGNHTFVNSRAVAIFIEHFKIKNTAPLDTYQLAYSETVKNAHFVIMATGDYERKFKAYGEYSRSMPLLDWMEKDLRSSLTQSDFRFVIGHEPAFSSGASEGLYTGMDKDLQKRDQLWEIFKQNQVRTYFCSHELLYDRSNREGVWQIISGGIDDRLKKSNNTLHHFVLLTVPDTDNEMPKIKAIDADGRVWDEFEMLPQDRPVHHFRISHR